LTSPITVSELEELCQAEGARSIRTLVAIRDSARASGVARLKAIEMMLDRGFGKPVVSITHCVIRSVADLTDDEFDEALLADEEDREAEPGAIH
jgi:hypothetical protein